MSEEDLIVSLKSSIEANKKIRSQTLSMINDFQKEIPTPKYTKSALKFYQSLNAKIIQQTEMINEEIKDANEKYMTSLNCQLAKVKKEVKIYSDQIEFMQSVRNFDVDSNSLNDLINFLQEKVSFLENEINQNHQKVQDLKSNLHKLQARNFEERNKQAQENWKIEVSLEKEHNQINSPFQRRYSDFIQSSNSTPMSPKLKMHRTRTFRDKIFRNLRKNTQ